MRRTKPFLRKNLRNNQRKTQKIQSKHMKFFSQNPSPRFMARSVNLITCDGNNYPIKES